MEPTRDTERDRKRAYRAWSNMRSRCRDQNRPDWKYYGGRGIKVCDRWARFAAFLEDMGMPGEGMTLDRIERNGDYEPGNCRWITIQDQQRNRRSNRPLAIGGVTKLLVEWCEQTGIHYGTAHARLAEGWPAELAIDPNATWRRVVVRPENWRGERIGTSKLTEDDVRWIRANRQVPAKEAAAKLGVSASCVYHIRSGTAWPWLVA